MTYPVTVFLDGFGRERPAQVGACRFSEMRQALESAAIKGCQRFVIVSHNFEMLKPGLLDPDFVVVRRFEKLCRYLANSGTRFSVGGFGSHAAAQPSPRKHQAPRTGMLPTVWRVAEQIARRGLS